MTRFALKLGYFPDLAYSGFSHQLKDPLNIFTIVRKAIIKARLLRNEEIILFASRTDRGVGAISQVVCFNSSSTFSFCPTNC